MGVERAGFTDAVNDLIGEFYDNDWSVADACARILALKSFDPPENSRSH